MQRPGNVSYRSFTDLTVLYRSINDPVTLCYRCPKDLQRIIKGACICNMCSVACHMPQRQGAEMGSLYCCWYSKITIHQFLQRRDHAPDRQALAPGVAGTNSLPSHHQHKCWTNYDLSSVRSVCIHPGVISQDTVDTKTNGLKDCTFEMQTVSYRHQWQWPLQWHDNEGDCVSNHLRLDCLLNRLFRRRSKKTSKLRVTGICVGNSLVTGEFPAHRALCERNPPTNDGFLSQRSVTRSFGVFFVLHLNKRLSKQIKTTVIWDAIPLIMTSLWCFGSLPQSLHGAQDILSCMVVWEAVSQLQHCQNNAARMLSVSDPWIQS